MTPIILYNGKRYACRYKDLSKLAAEFDYIYVVRIPQLKLAYVYPIDEAQFKKLAIIRVDKPTPC